jgi:hypothetical protein
MAPQNRWFSASQNTDYIYKALTDGTVTNLTGGKIPKMNAQQAAGLIGSWLIETGRKDLSNLDVVEKGSGRGRGLSQYTGVRRGPYDQAVAAARAAGKDPNSAQWQIEYFAKEYLNRDLIGWTQVFERMPNNLKGPGEYAAYFTGSAKEGKGYFRPGVPHTDRRMQAANEVYKHYYTGGTPKVTAPAAQPQNKPAIPQGPLNKLLNKLGIKGKDQGFAIDKLQKNLGNIAATPNAGFAIFDSVAKGNSKKAWNSLPKSQKKAWSAIGGQLGIQAQTSGQTYKMPSRTNTRTSQAYGPKAVDLSVGGVKPGDLGYGRNNTKVGGLPGLGEIAQAGIANYGYFKGQSNRYGQAAFGANSSGWARSVNQYSYGSGMNLGRSLGINTSATAAAGAKYGGAAMSMNTSANVAASYGKQ